VLPEILVNPGRLEHQEKRVTLQWVWVKKVTEAILVRKELAVFKGTQVARELGEPKDLRDPRERKATRELMGSRERKAILGLMVSPDSRVKMENRDCRVRRVVPDFRGPQVKQTLDFT